METKMILEKYIDYLYNQHNRLFEIGTDHILYKLKGHTPNSLKKITDKQLLDLHRKCHMLYKAHKKNKKFIEEIIEIHNIIVKEMLRRKMKHITPLGD